MTFDEAATVRTACGLPLRPGGAVPPLNGWGGPLAELVYPDGDTSALAWSIGSSGRLLSQFSADGVRADGARLTGAGGGEWFSPSSLMAAYAEAMEADRPFWAQFGALVRAGLIK